MDDNSQYLCEMVTPKKAPRKPVPHRLVISAHTGLNAEIFPDVLRLHVKDGARIADVTYGKGAFWKFVPIGLYDTYFSDLNTGKNGLNASVRKMDCRKLTYEDASFDAVVLDPPYVASGKTIFGSLPGFEEAYRNNVRVDQDGLKSHEAVLGLYVSAGIEAARVLKKKGKLVVKCQDEVCGGKQCLTHVEIINEYAKLGFICDDLFVVVRLGTVTVSRMNKQKHARKVHGYFLCFIKT